MVIHPIISEIIPSQDRIRVRIICSKDLCKPVIALKTFFGRYQQLRNIYFFTGSGMVIPGWEIFGSTLVTHSFVRLTPDQQSRAGGLYNNNVSSFQTFIVIYWPSSLIIKASWIICASTGISFSLTGFLYAFFFSLYK